VKPSHAPPTSMASMTVLPAIANYSKAPRNTRVLMHPRFGHIYDDALDDMCQNQTVIGLTKFPPPTFVLSVLL
jgi:hypothetical protein